MRPCVTALHLKKKKNVLDDNDLAAASVSVLLSVSQTRSGFKRHAKFACVSAWQSFAVRGGKVMRDHTVFQKESSLVCLVFVILGEIVN